MKNICFLIPELSLGGAQKQCLALASAINCLTQHRVVVVTLRNSGQMEHLLRDYNVESVNLNVTSGFDLRAVRRLRIFMKNQEIDVLISWLHSADVIGFLATRFLKIDWILNERDSKYEKKIRYVLRFASGIFANKIVANSDQGISYWRRVFFWKSFHRIHNIVTVKAPKILYDRDIDIIYGGRFSNQKNILFTSSLLSRLVIVKPEMRIVLRGEGELYERCKETLKIGLATGSIDLNGYDSNFYSLLSRSKTLISLSHHEGSPNVVLEALAMGTTPILSSIPEHVAIVGRGYPFLIYPEMTDEQGIRIILEAINSKDAAAMMHSAHFLSMCSERSVTNQFLDIIEEERI